MKKVVAITAGVLMLSGCVPPSQNTYGEREVGHDTIVLYGIIKSVRPVDIKGENSGAGAGAGALAGGVGGSMIGRGNGSLAGLLVGAVIGGVGGAMAEQAMKDRQGIEYIIKMSETGDTRSVVQNIAKKDVPISKGQCVMLQISGSYQRVLPDDDESDCPVPVKHKHHIKTVTNHAGTTTEISDDPNK